MATTRHSSMPTFDAALRPTSHFPSGKRGDIYHMVC